VADGWEKNKTKHNKTTKNSKKHRKHMKCVIIPLKQNLINKNIEQKEEL
jgi:hypothetical protein